MAAKPRNKNTKPIKNSPTDLVVLRLKNSSGTANAKMGKHITVMSTLKPKKATIQVVNVLPTLAPIITAMLWPSVIRPALTKLTTITVEALELWMRAVTSIPVITPKKRLRVIHDRMLRKRSPAAFCKPSLMTFMP